MFDLEADPEERENLAEDNTQKDVLKHMRELVIEEYRVTAGGRYAGCRRQIKSRPCSSGISETKREIIRMLC